MSSRLQFIYNAKTGIFNKLTDFAHKAISPATYQCNLCTLTHGTFTRKQEWADYIRSMPLEAEFIYRDEWKHRSRYKSYPLVVLQREGDEVEVLLDARQLSELKSLEALKQVLTAALLETKV